MQQVRGVVLVLVLIMLMIMALVVSAMLVIVQLSNKTANAGQLQLTTSQNALKEHLAQVAALQHSEQADAVPISSCPAQFAAWSGGVLQCELIQVSTQSYSENRLFYNSYSSLVLIQKLELEQE